MRRGAEHLPAGNAIEYLPLNLILIVLVDRVYDEAQAYRKKEGWIDVCDALLAVASILMKHAVGNEQPHRVRDISIIGKRARDSINKKIEPEKRYSWKGDAKEIFENPNLEGAIMWLEPCFEEHVRQVIQEDRITFGEHDRPIVQKHHILTWLNTFLENRGREVIQKTHVPKTEQELLDRMGEMRAILSPDEREKTWAELISTEEPLSASDYLNWWPE